MRKSPWNNDGAANLTPLEREVADLRDENRRLKGLMELREDRSELERFQIQSRNKILSVACFALVALAVMGVYMGISKHQFENELRQSNDTIYKLKHGALFIPNDSGQ